MTKYTPGPWKANLDKALTQVEAADGLIVADITEDHPNLAEQYANARLIAAAPEMLEALKVMINHSDAQCNRCDVFHTARNTTLAAISKAEGRES